MENPIETELTKQILDNIVLKDIIYAELGGVGAMGCSGGVMLYLIVEDKLIRYKTNVRNNEDVYYQASRLLLSYQTRITRSNIPHREYIFDLFDGGYGNYVFINRDVTLETKRMYYFIYTRNGIEYHIMPSAIGVFVRVEFALNNHKTKIDNDFTTKGQD